MYITFINDDFVGVFTTKEKARREVIRSIYCCNNNDDSEKETLIRLLNDYHDTTALAGFARANISEEDLINYVSNDSEIEDDAFADLFGCSIEDFKLDENYY